jgi:hypothetical protein
MLRLLATVEFVELPCVSASTGGHCYSWLVLTKTTLDWRNTGSCVVILLQHLYHFCKSAHGSAQVHCLLAAHSLRASAVAAALGPVLYWQMCQHVTFTNHTATSCIRGTADKSLPCLRKIHSGYNFNTTHYPSDVFLIQSPQN